ncbi:alpha/beta hydrolase family protein [Vibrio sonorensis]|uniref:alpha/beta hydrolase family protein n=1 Tax=Vibrio sonorensis TaxID=1004316 RepID=UPI0008D91A40|nr:prolyl oligopeptidase family serine peptidase [Vibrio sonorensis]
MKHQNRLVATLGVFAAIISSHVFASQEFTANRTDGSKIHFYLKKADPAIAPTELLVIAQGSDCNSVYHNNKINQTFSHILPNADVLTVEKYGINSSLPWSDDVERADCPQAYLVHDSLDQRVMDYKQVISLLKSERDYSRIVVVGGSEGALVSNLLAAEQDVVDQSVALNGGGRWFTDDMLHSIKSEVPSEDLYQQIEAEVFEFVTYLKNSEPSDFVESGHGYHWWKSMVELDQQAVIGKITSPILIVQAEKDSNVSFEQTEIMVNKLAEKQSNITFKTYPNLDHSFIAPNGDNLSKQVAEDVARWLEQF